MIGTVTLNPAVDQTMRVDGPLAPDEVIRVEDARFDPGGKGINVSKYLTAMGTETVATGVLGGFVGRHVAERLESAGIATAFVDIEGVTRMNTTVLAADDEYKLNQAGPQVSPADVDAVVEKLRTRSPGTVVVAGSLPPGLDSDAIDRLARAGPWETVVDVDGPLLRELDAEFELCKPNVTELEAATGREITGVESAIEAARELRGDRFDRVLASLGPEGAVLVSADGVVHEPAIDCEVVDTVGAGDALLAGVLAATDAGADDADALHAGVVSATAAVSTQGTTLPSLPEPTASGVD
ncbi:1-phosphofructokinase family hexose kinase [Haloarcula sp. S1CR25-12]|uniref:1-phosphofructokinase family hexose kinase n=1 Tax=Haloarcula saliterrae TaxID=2950534 RepID=A0ABU2FHM9_9EURY|nr:1-phosphofructokinase [Haloarcula sp. S1CR25-12]MDS0261286.1 1-phosphofructokinase family hexose kinase [Haloarcula sp. S1CR25-12]